MTSFNIVFEELWFKDLDNCLTLFMLFIQKFTRNSSIEREKNHLKAKIRAFPV